MSLTVAQTIENHDTRENAIWDGKVPDCRSYNLGQSQIALPSIWDFPVPDSTFGNLGRKVPDDHLLP